MEKNYNLITEAEIENIKSTFNFTTDQQVYQWILKTFPKDVFYDLPEIMGLVVEATIQLGKIEIRTGVFDTWQEDYDFVFAKEVFMCTLSRKMCVNGGKCTDCLTRCYFMFFDNDKLKRIMEAWDDGN